MPATHPLIELMASLHRRLVEWPLYDEATELHGIGTKDGSYIVGYGPHLPSDAIQPEATLLDIEVRERVFYINSVTIARSARGQGHGAALYRLLEEVARDAGCERIKMTCSGWTPSGETRQAYCVRKFGYTATGQMTVEKLLQN